MTAILLFILLVIVAVVAMAIVNQNKAELGSRAEDILLEQARVAELKAELERAEVQEREELAALRLEMQILEKENAKNVLTLEKELIASGLKGKDAEDALRKELEETRLAEQVKVMAIQLQLDKVKTQEQNKVKTIQFELDKSQARIGLMEANVEKLKNKPIAEIADLKKKLSEAVISTRDAQEKADAQASLIKSQKSEASKELKAIQAELNTLKQAEADKRKTLNTKLGDSADTIEDLEEEIAYLKSQAASVNKSPDIEKKKISIQSDEDRADAMDSQDIVENDEKKKSGNTPQSSSGRVITKGPRSLEMSPAMREKLQAARYKAENNEKNEALVDPASGRGAAPVPSINLEKLGPPSNIMRPAVCRDIPGSPVDSCGRPSKLPPAPTTGYLDNGLGFCKSGQIFASPGWALLNPGEPKKFASSFDDPIYKEYAKRGQAKCDADPNCKYVTVWRDAGYRMYNSGAGNCSSKNDPSGANKSWKKMGYAEKPPTGYLDNGLGFCKSGQIFASPGWALLNPGEPRKMASSFNDPLYREYAKRGQAKCDADPNCKYVTVWRDAGYRMYNSGAGNCSSKNDPSGANKSWKKMGYAEKPPPLPKLPPPPPPTGYVDNGPGFCKSGQIFASPGWALLNPSEPRKMASSFNDPLYREYAKRGQAKCDADPNCKFVTVWRDAGYRMYNSGAGNCSSKNDPSGANKSWKKPPNFGRPFRPPPPTFGTRLDVHFRPKRPSPPPPPPPPAKKNCAYSSVNLRGPGGWFGWSSKKDGLGREMKGIVVSKHKVNESAVGGGKKCCEALGCPSNCKDPGVGKHVYKKRATIGRIGYYASYWPSYKGKFTLERTSGQKACDNNSYV